MRRTHFPGPDGFAKSIQQGCANCGHLLDCGSQKVLSIQRVKESFSGLLTVDKPVLDQAVQHTLHAGFRAFRQSSDFAPCPRPV